LVEGLCQRYEPKQLRVLAVAPAPEFPAWASRSWWLDPDPADGRALLEA